MCNIDIVYIIETNYESNNNSFQSRIITYSSWEKYISLYTHYDGKADRPINGTMWGRVLPYNAKIKNLVYNNEQLSCDIVLFNQQIKTRFAQKVDKIVIDNEKNDKNISIGDEKNDRI